MEPASGKLEKKHIFFNIAETKQPCAMTEPFKFILSFMRLSISFIGNANASLVRSLCFSRLGGYNGTVTSTLFPRPRA